MSSVRTSAASLEKLFHRHGELLREIASVTTQLRRLSKNGATENSARKPAAARKSAKRRSWFERGEAVGLMTRLARKPMAQADLVRALAASKGYDKGLPAVDAKRFQSAAYQAIANAVAGKKLVTAKDGSVRARA